MRLSFTSQDIEKYDAFVRSLRRENRFVVNSTAQEFVDVLLSYAERHASATISRGQPFFRARLHPFGGSGSIQPLSSSEIHAPPATSAVQGRANPVGIPYLYMASRVRTAVAEVRPWVDAVMTVAKLRPVRDLTVIDATLRADGARPDSVEFSHRDRRGQRCWGLVSALYSEPVHRDDGIAYLPTQYLAELMKARGFDGLKYGSHFDDKGYNVVLFQPEMARVVSRRLAQVTHVAYDYHVWRS